MKRILAFALSLAALLSSVNAGAVKFTGLKIIDKDYLLVGFRDGEIHYRDNATGESAYLGHTFVEGDDTLYVFQLFFYHHNTNYDVGNKMSLQNNYAER